MAQLTKMQQKIYDYIVQAIQDQGYPPSVREIGEAVGLKSPSTVHFHLKHLEELGVIGKQAGKGRALTLTEAPQENQVPIVGNVAAGSPILAQECIEDYLTFDTGGRDGEYFALRVRGESMINAGILPDDLVVVHQQPAANNGEIMVALLGRGHGEAPEAAGERGLAPAGKPGLSAHRRPGGPDPGQGSRRDPPVLTRRAGTAIIKGNRTARRSERVCRAAPEREGRSPAASRPAGCGRRCVRERAGCGSPPHWPASQAASDKREWNREISPLVPQGMRGFLFAERKLTIEGENAMYLYNSATHKKEEFKTHTPGHVEMYTCGPTVYHFAHIGNLRSYIMEDVLEKYLRYAGYSVNRVMNITDVGHLTSDADQGEDKMLKGARREHKTVMEIAQYYTDAFFEDCRKLNIKRPDVVQPATGLIDDYIRIITKLLDTGYAYVAGGNVYFDTSKLERYYIFNDHNEEDLAVGVREGVEEDTNKRNRNDFVLWFTKSKFEDQALKWDSPWGVGYPGWHIECSGISMKYNGEYLDLHCGGVDNAFPHHTNEIAQSESYLGHPWCPQWCHVAHLNTEGGKMSKSKGEFLTVSLLEQKGYDPLAYRFFCLQSHYRKSLVFTWENLDNAVAAYNKLLSKIAALTPGKGEVDPAVLDELKARFTKAMDNDLNTSMAVTVLYDVLKAKTTDATKLAALDSFDQVLGLKLTEKAAALRKAQEAAPAAGGFTVVSEDGREDPQVEALIRARADAKKAKNFAEADRIRDELKAQGVEITDVPGGVRWKRA